MPCDPVETLPSGGIGPQSMLVLAEEDTISSVMQRVLPLPTFDPHGARDQGHHAGQRSRADSATPPDFPNSETRVRRFLSTGVEKAR